MSKNGLFLIPPYSVTYSGGSLDFNNARISFAGVYSISFNGVFTSEYNNYIILFSAKRDGSSLVELSFRLRSSGTDASSGYTDQWLWANSSSLTAAGGSLVRAWPLYLHSNQINSSVVYYVMNPALPTQTLMRGFETEPNAGAAIWDTATYLQTAQAYDGCTFFNPSSLAFTGYAAIYGMRK